MKKGSYAKWKTFPSTIRNKVARRKRYKLLPGEPRAQNFNSPRGQLAVRTMAEVARIMGIHKSRVHQLERHAWWKIRQRLEL